METTRKYTIGVVSRIFRTRGAVVLPQVAVPAGPGLVLIQSKSPPTYSSPLNTANAKALGYWPPLNVGRGVPNDVHALPFHAEMAPSPAAISREVVRGQRVHRLAHAAAQPRQNWPSHAAMLLAAIPPMCVKSPPTISAGSPGSDQLQTA